MVDIWTKTHLFHVDADKVISENPYYVLIIKDTKIAGGVNRDEFVTWFDHDVFLSEAVL